MILPAVIASLAGWLSAPQLVGGLGLAAVAGGLTGLGAGLSNGCTSGHGVCGLSNMSARSLVAVVTFMATAGVTVYVARHLIGG